MKTETVNTAEGSKIEIGYIDDDGEMEVNITNIDPASLRIWITKEDAIELVKVLKKIIP